jgi:hypothetical protein
MYNKKQLVMEEWKDVVGYEGLYEVSNLGRVRNKKRNTMVTLLDNNGYHRVELWKNNKRRRYMLHRVVAQTWIPNDDDTKTQVNHINEIKTDNRVENLEWCTASYNNKYGHRIQKMLDTIREGRSSPRHTRRVRG